MEASLAIVHPKLDLPLASLVILGLLDILKRGDRCLYRVYCVGIIYIYTYGLGFRRISVRFGGFLIETPKP